jgi:hypothetical protein
VQTTVEPKQKMDRPLRVLIVEDAKSDVALLLLALRAGGFDVTHEAVATQAAMRAAMHQRWDLILSDYAMPQFSGRAALFGCIACHRLGKLRVHLICEGCERSKPPVSEIPRPAWGRCTPASSSRCRAQRHRATLAHAPLWWAGSEDDTPAH